jgi:hypothetical protein
MNNLYTYFVETRFIASRVIQYLARPKGGLSERDSSGTTEARSRVSAPEVRFAAKREGDGADSPTQAHKKSSYFVGAFFVRRSGSPK